MSDITFRAPTAEDLPAVVAILADDEFGENRESGGADVPEEYLRAFEEISRDSEQSCIRFKLEPGR